MIRGSDMAKGKLRFTQKDVTRAMKAARKAGCENPQAIITPDGCIIVQEGKPIEVQHSSSEWDDAE